MKAIVPTAIGSGILLLLLSVLWPVLFPATRTWTDEKSRRLKELAGKTQFLMGKIDLANSKPNMLGGESPAEMKKKADEMRTELEALQEEFRSAKEDPQTVGTYMKWGGIAVLVVGIIGHLATKDT